MSVPNEPEPEHYHADSPVEFTRDHLRALNHRAAVELGTEDRRFGNIPALFTRVFPFPLSSPGDDVHLWTTKSRHGAIGLQRGVSTDEQGLPKLTSWAAGGYPRLLFAEVVAQIRRLDKAGDDPHYVDLTPTLNGFITDLGLPRNGNTRRALRDQLEAFALSTLTFTTSERQAGGKLLRTKPMPAFAEEVVMWFPEQSPLDEFTPYIQAAQWLVDIALGDTAPVRLDFMAKLVGKPLAMDVMLWLGRVTYELHQTGKSSRTFTWQELFDEFTHDYSRVIDFRTKWKRALKQTMSYYPDLMIDPDYPDDRDKRRTVVRVYKSPLMIAKS